MDAIVAVNDDWGIGNDGTQSIVLKADRAFFRKKTMGAAIIVGRYTLADFPGGKPLKDRVNILLTKQNMQVEGAIVVHTPADALEEAKKYEKCYVIGGASVYMQLFPELDRIYVTKINAHPESTAFFPNLDRNPAWVCEYESEEMEENGISFRFCTYRQIR